jgi:hypothetical protein
VAEASGHGRRRFRRKRVWASCRQSAASYELSRSMMNIVVFKNTIRTPQTETDHMLDLYICLTAWRRRESALRS